MRAEFDALLANRTWDLVPCPPSANVVTGKWICRYKLKPDGFLERYKACWVLRGFSQHEGIDFSETFNLFVKPVTVRIDLSSALSSNWSFHQLDVKNAFLHGSLAVTVYSQQPDGFLDLTHLDYVCRLNRSLYGLKKVPHAWFSRFASHLLSLGFVGSKADTSLFIYK